MAGWLCSQLKRAADAALGFLRGPHQPALGCLSNEDIDRILSQEDPGREDQE
jgi:hypothetical protein